MIIIYISSDFTLNLSMKQDPSSPSDCKRHITQEIRLIFRICY